MSQPTPTGQAYAGVPESDPAVWRLIVDGWVAGPRTLRLGELHTWPQHTVRAAVGCVHTDDAAPYTALWRGVPLSALLDAVRPQERAQVLNLYSADGYATSLPLDAARGALLALAVNEVPLPHAQGGPARLILPGRAGYKLPKWVRRLDVAEQPVLGPWEQRGAPTDGFAPARVGFEAGPWPRPARVGVPMPLAGWASGGVVPAEGVALSVDDAPWVIMLCAPSADADPVLAWATAWTPTQAGRVVVRAQAVVGGARVGPQAALPVAVRA